MRRASLLETLCVVWLMSSIAVEEQHVCVGRVQRRLLLLTPVGMVPISDWTSTPV